jgi:hypothetical protein
MHRHNAQVRIKNMLPYVPVQTEYFNFALREMNDLLQATLRQVPISNK